jgi:Fic family protein
VSESEDSPLLCDPSQKEDLEARNGAVQLQYIAEKIKLGVKSIRESHILELQSIAIEDIYPCGGTYRDVVRNAYIDGSEHRLPEPALVPSLVRDAIEWINDEQNERNYSALDRAAYALWRFNWIHPFRGGNGRTSRTIAYIILCIDYGDMLPGKVTIPTFIKRERDEYIRALRLVDKSELANPSKLDITPMSAFLERMLAKQLATIIDGLSAKH